MSRVPLIKPENIDDRRTKTMVDFALKVNVDAHAITDDDISELRGIGLGDNTRGSIGIA